MYDILIKNTRSRVGSGAPWYRADVAVKGGKIVKIGHLCGQPGHEAENTVDGQDRYLAPGFIDIHSHSDTTLMKYPKAESRILQGVTQKSEETAACQHLLSAMTRREKKSSEPI